MMIVVSDTTAISNLVQINQLELLEKIYRRIIIPKSVHDELLALNSFGIPIQKILKQEWIEIKEVSSGTLLEKFLAELDQGEAEAVVLAIELKADFLLIDEKLGRRIAKENQIPIIGTLGILLKSKELGLIGSVQEQMDALRNIGFWINADLYNKMLNLEKKV
ncbi:MAG: DUF3368 domain-containing protein [Lewinellaceae bacterium]|nr:DUF3368 domain-containing protein [Lewinellaceae bacterium]